ncbi:MAG: hypothetical protein AB7I36_08930 [Rhodospirillaceae bacterium]
MTHHTSKLSRHRAADNAQTSTHRGCAASTYRGFAAAAPTGISAARASTSLALSMMVALRYLEGRAGRQAPANAIPDPALS